MGGLNEITDGSYSLLNVTYYNYNKPIFIKKTKTKNYIFKYEDDNPRTVRTTNS